MADRAVGARTDEQLTCARDCHGSRMNRRRIRTDPGCAALLQDPSSGFLPVRRGRRRTGWPDPPRGFFAICRARRRPWGHSARRPASHIPVSTPSTRDGAGQDKSRRPVRFLRLLRRFLFDRDSFDAVPLRRWAARSKTGFGGAAVDAHVDPRVGAGSFAQRIARSTRRLIAKRRSRIARVDARTRDIVPQPGPLQHVPGPALALEMVIARDPVRESRPSMSRDCRCRWARSHHPLRPTDLGATNSGSASMLPSPSQPPWTSL